MPIDYPWRLWTNGEEHSVYAHDHNLQPEELADVIHTYALSHSTRVVVNTKDPNNLDRVLFCFYPPGATKPRLTEWWASYPWTVWADGNPHVLTFGVDFSVAVANLRKTLSKYATRYGLEIAVDSYGNRILFCFYPANSPRPKLVWPNTEES